MNTDPSRSGSRQTSEIGQARKSGDFRYRDLGSLATSATVNELVGVMVADPIPATRRSYPLFALFLLLTACAVLAALLAPTARGIAAGQISAANVVWGSLAGALLLAVVGAVIGLVTGRGVFAFVTGGIIGAILGAIAAVLAFTPRGAGGQILVLTLIGSGLLVLFAASLRTLSGRRR